MQQGVAQDAHAFPPNVSERNTQGDGHIPESIEQALSIEADITTYCSCCAVDERWEAAQSM